MQQVTLIFGLHCLSLEKTSENIYRLTSTWSFQQGSFIKVSWALHQSSVQETVVAARLEQSQSRLCSTSGCPDLVLSNQGLFFFGG